MRIAFVSTIFMYPWGGADAIWTSAAEAATGRGDDVLIAISELTAHDSRVGAMVARGATLFIRPAPAGPTPWWKRAWRRQRWAVNHPGRIVARIRTFAPDLLILNCGGTYDSIFEPDLIDWLRKTGTPYRIIANFQNEHPVFGETDRLRACEDLKAADRVFFVSPRNLEVTRLHLLSPLPNAECIHYPLRTASEPAWPEPEPWSLACLARLEPIKGLDILLPALASVLADSIGWQLNVYGRGAQRDYLEACARYCGIGDRVNFLGFVPNIEDIWSRNHLLISCAFDEGMPLVLPEAMLRKRAALVTQVGGATEWIEHGRTGFICPAPTTNLLAESVLEAWSQRLRWREMGEAAAVRARSLYRPNDFQKILA